MKEFFQQLLFHDVVRGHHATGVAAIDTIDRKLVVEKKAIASPEFLLDKEMMGNLFDHKHNFNIYIGHNRWATSGAKDADENAHPFIHGNIVGVHNGSLRNQRLLDDHKDFKVDSDNLYHHLNKNGLDDTIAKSNGAYALVWYDRTDNSLNFIRNEERPLCVAKLNNGYYVWASEMGMLKWLITRHKTLSIDTHEKDGVKYNSIWNIEKNQHMKIVYKPNTRQMDGLPKVVNKTPPTFPVENYYNSGKTWGTDYRSDRYSSTTSHVASSYQQKQKANLDKFLVGAEVSKSVLEVIFKGIEIEASSTGYKATIAMFEYVNAKGVTVMAHVFVHEHSGYVKDLKADDIGKKFYGTICTINDSAQASYKVQKNEELGISLSLNCITKDKPNRFFAYGEEEKQEGGAQNVLPFRGGQTSQQASTTIGKESSKSSPQGSTSSPTFLDRVVTLNNVQMSQKEFMDILAENASHCANCGSSMVKLPMIRVFCHEHYDQEEGKKYNYLTCSRGCHNEIETFTAIIDEDYSKNFGGTDV